MAIVPDTKNWTWVLERPCPQCGFDAAATEGTAVAGLMRVDAEAWAGVLGRLGIRTRPDESTWSPLEYAAHVRDVFAVMDGRLRLMLEQDDPEFENWDQDATALAERYGEQDPAVVAAELRENAARFADRLDQVPADAWGRRGVRSNGSEFTVDTLARYAAHDVVHHLWDVRERPPRDEPQVP
jgi:hypothetical protein